MTDFPVAEVPPVFVSSFSRYCYAAVAARNQGVAAAPASATYPAANRAIYIPFYLPLTWLAQGGGLVNGSSVTGNADFGIYSAAGNRIISRGSVARSGASAPQLDDFASFALLTPGRYYMGFSASSGAANTAWLNTSVTTAIGKSLGLLQEASAFPLPATMTPAAWASTGLPLVGFYCN